MLDLMIEMAIADIKANHRAGGDNSRLPLQAERAVRQVFEHFGNSFSEQSVVVLLFDDAVKLQKSSAVVPDLKEFAIKLLVPFIAGAVRQQMGPEYDRLLQSRLEELAPSPWAFAE